jgi:hypothetical protein
VAASAGAEKLLRSDSARARLADMLAATAGEDSMDLLELQHAAGLLAKLRDACRAVQSADWRDPQLMAPLDALTLEFKSLAPSLAAFAAAQVSCLIYRGEKKEKKGDWIFDPPSLRAPSPSFFFSLSFPLCRFILCGRR